MDIKDTIKAGVALYTGWHVDHVDVCCDPQVPGAYAVRASCRRLTKKGVHKTSRTMDYLISGDWRFTASRLSPELVERHLEDVEYVSWPPTSGKLKFI